MLIANLECSATNYLHWDWYIQNKIALILDFTIFFNMRNFNFKIAYFCLLLLYTKCDLLSKLHYDYSDIFKSLIKWRKICKDLM